MNFFRRAIRYCWRQKVRSIILLLVFTLLASAALIALSVGHATAEETDDVKQTVGASIRIEIDSGNTNLYGSGSKNEWGTAYQYNGDYITQEVIDAITKVGGVVSYSAESEEGYYGAAVNFDYFPGAFNVSVAGHGQSAPYVITDSKGEPLAYSQFQRVWQYVVVRSTKPRNYYKYVNGESIKYTVTPTLGMTQKNQPKIRYTIDFDVTPHQLRHTYITNLLYAGVDPISLGHPQPDKLPFTLSDAMGRMKHQGERMDLTCSQVGNKSAGKKSSELLAEQVGQSKNQIFRYIRLTELIPELLDMVDEKKIALNPAYELSFLKKEEQRDLLDAMDSEQATPSLSQAQRLKKYSQEGHLTLDMMRVIMGEEKKSDLDKVTLSADILRKYFPKSYTPQRMQETIIKLLEGWQKKRQRDQER